MIVDWSDFTYSSDGSNTFPKLFLLSGADACAAIPNTASVSPPIWTSRLRKSANDLLDEFDPDKHSSASIWRKYSIDLGQLDYPEDVVVLWSFTHQIPILRPHFVGEWAALAQLTDEEVLRKILREDLQLHPEIQKRVADFKREYFLGSIIGVHVRYMDRKTSIHDFLRHIDRRLEHAPDAMIFLATDNQEAEATIKNRYSHVVTTPKWFPASGISMHQNPECPDRLKNAIEALVDMYLLAECDHLVFPGSSTFSWLSSLISNMPRENMVDIEHRNVRIRLKKLVKSWIQ